MHGEGPSSSLICCALECSRGGHMRITDKVYRLQPSALAARSRRPVQPCVSVGSLGPRPYPRLRRVACRFRGDSTPAHGRHGCRARDVHVCRHPPPSRPLKEIDAPTSIAATPHDNTHRATPTATATATSPPDMDGSAGAIGGATQWRWTPAIRRQSSRLHRPGLCPLPLAQT